LFKIKKLLIYLYIEIYNKKEMFNVLKKK